VFFIFSKEYQCYRQCFATDFGYLDNIIGQKTTIRQLICCSVGSQ
jgi:hypothetical protein